MAEFVNQVRQWDQEIDDSEAEGAETRESLLRYVAPDAKGSLEDKEWLNNWVDNWDRRVSEAKEHWTQAVIEWRRKPNKANKKRVSHAHRVLVARIDQEPARIEQEIERRGMEVGVPGLYYGGSSAQQWPLWKLAVLLIFVAAAARWIGRSKSD